MASLLRSEARVSACSGSSRGEETAKAGTGLAVENEAELGREEKVPSDSVGLDKLGCRRWFPLMRDRAGAGGTCVAVGGGVGGDGTVGG